MKLCIDERKALFNMKVNNVCKFMQIMNSLSVTFSIVINLLMRVFHTRISTKKLFIHKRSSLKNEII